VFGAMGLFVGQLFATLGINVPAGLTVVCVAALCWYAAYRGVQISAIVMLVLETISVAMISTLIGIILVHHGFTIDTEQLTLKGVGPSAIGLGIATAIFSLVGFESATAFGAEARSPLTTIPRAVILSVIIASGFFIIALYAEILALHGAPKSLDQLTSPLGTIAQMLSLPYLRIPITIGALCSAFSVALACITTSGRIALSMARAQILPRALDAIEPKHGTPHIAVTYATVAPLLIALVCLLRGLAPIDIFNYCGTLSSCGFIIIYALIAVAAPVYAKRNGGVLAKHRLVSVVALVCLLVPAVTLFYPVPTPPTLWFPYVFVAYLFVTWLWSRSRAPQPTASG
jgi:amino acid transporter